MSYLPEIAYRYGKDARGYALLLALTDPALKRREYPEVSFSVIRTVAVGVLGIEPDAAKRQIKTLSHLTAETPSATLENVPIFKNKITVSHAGRAETAFTNELGPPNEWKAAFPGSFRTLLPDGKAVPAQIERDAVGNSHTLVIIQVSSARRVTVRTPSGNTKPRSCCPLGQQS